MVSMNGSQKNITLWLVLLRILGLLFAKKTLCYWYRAVLETKAGQSVRDRQLLVRTRNFLHISWQINLWILENSDQDL